MVLDNNSALKEEAKEIPDAFIRYLGRCIMEELKSRGLLSEAAFLNAGSHLKEKTS